MASHPHLFEDQTDEDFFDKLVDDEFGAGGSSSGAEGMRRGFSNLSLADEGGRGEDTAPAGEAQGKEAAGGTVVDASEADVVPSEDGGSTIVQSDSQAFRDAAPSAENHPGAAEEAGSLDSSAGQGGKQSKGTSVKVVQWSAFSASADQPDMGGFGSYSDLFPEGQGGSSDNMFALQEVSGSGVENRGMDVGSYYDNSLVQHDGGQVFDGAGQQGAYAGSAEQKDVQQYNPDATDHLYWESLYPGWKYDYGTGQWYQVDSQEGSSSAQVDGHASNTLTGELGSQETAYSDAHLSANEVVSEQSASVSCLQQTAYTMAETVAESSMMDSVTKWNQVSQGSIEYPPNMVFDPQYPYWYYDTNTQQWCSLESYIQNVQVTTTKVQDQLPLGSSASLDGRASTQSNNFYDNATNQFDKQSFLGQRGAEVGNQWGGQTSSYSSQGGWQPVVAERSTSQEHFSENDITGSIHAPTKTLENYLEKHTAGSFSQHASWQPAAAVQSRHISNSSENQMTGSLQDSTTSLGSYSQKHTLGSFSPQVAWQPGSTDQGRSTGNFSESQMAFSSSDSTGSIGNFSDRNMGTERNEAVLGQRFGLSNGPAAFQGFAPADSMPQFTQPKTGQMTQFQEPNLSHSYYGNLNSSSYLQQPYQSGKQSFQGGNLSHSQVTSASSEGRSSAGRPPHALVTFGFGGKVVVMKDSSANLSYGSQDTGGKTVSILSLVDVVKSNDENSTVGLHSRAYFDSLCNHSFPGPLVGGNAATKDLNKWIDERISSCGASFIDHKKSEHLRLILSLLKISFQHYGKLRSPFGTDPSILETDGPELAVTKLFSSVRENAGHPTDYGSGPNCMHNLLTEGQIRRTAAEVQHLLVSGKRKEALKCAQEGLLWGPAIVLAAQLGEKFYVDTVRKMAQYQFVSGSPLRTLCLLIAGQPADVFSADSFSNNFSGGIHVSKQAVANGMLDSWEENLAIITANRTKDDELVMIHLGDCLWKERDEVVAAHTCYLVAEANFESYSDSARLCLVGADHWKCPRTYASPDAIQTYTYHYLQEQVKALVKGYMKRVYGQRTEFYEYSKVLGNSQFVLLPFQPYKLIYAYMLAELGKVSDSLRYCQAILKILKNSSRAPEAETWKQLASSLEERLKTHQQGGYGSNLAPAKLVGKLFTSIDKSISRMMGSPPTSLPPMPQTNVHDSLSVAPKVSSSQSTMAISSLMPSPSVEKINEWTGDNRRIMHNRSVSEPDFGRSPKQENSDDPSSTDLQNKSSNAGASRFGRFGSQLFQKTIGWVARSRPDRQAKLGESNKFYYDEKLKRWVEEGVESPAEVAALPPPPTTSFQNVHSDYNINNALSQSFSSNERTETKPSTSAESSSSMPPIPPSTNQFSARGRLGVRSRYVDTFNKGGGAPATSFQAPSAPTVKPVSSANFFIPAPIASIQSTGDVTEAIAEASSNEDVSSMVVKDSPYSSLSSSSSSHSMPRFPSVDSITPMASKGTGMHLQGNGPITAPARAASWCGSFSDALNHNMSESKSFDTMPPTLSNLSRPSEDGPLVNGGNVGDDLHEVEL